MIDYENIAKRMIALSYLGGVIEHCDGHRWIYWSSVGHDFDMYELARKHKVELPRSKRYDGIESILNAIDSFLPKVGFTSLMDIFNQLDEERKSEGGVILLKE